MKIIGITGSSGSGKSTVCKILEQNYKVKIIDADKVVRRLSKKGSEYLKDIVNKFGQEILDEQGELDRYKLSELIYNDEKKRELLNESTFNYVVKEIKREVEEEKEINTIIIDAPLLFESKLNEICDIVIGVISEKKLQIERIMVRDLITFEQAEKRLEAQQTNEFYIQNCDVIIQNNNDFMKIEKRVEMMTKHYNITKKLQ